MPKPSNLEIQYPVAMTKSVTLYHHLTQIHHQRFFSDSSSRMASIQGLRINGDADAEVERLETVFRASLESATSELNAEIDAMTKLLTTEGIDPDLSKVAGGVECASPITSPWANKLLNLYVLTDRALMTLELLWIGEVVTTLEKRDKANEIRAKLANTVRQIQRTVTQAFQEARRKQQMVRVPRAYGETGEFLARHLSAEDFERVKMTPVADLGAVIKEINAAYKDHQEAAEIKHSLKEIHAIRRALKERQDAQAEEANSDDAGTDGESVTEDRGASNG